MAKINPIEGCLEVPLQKIKDTHLFDTSHRAYN